MPTTYLEITTTDEKSQHWLSLLGTIYEDFARRLSTSMVPVYVAMQPGLLPSMNAYGLGCMFGDTYDTLHTESGLHQYVDLKVWVSVYYLPTRDEFGIDHTEIVFEEQQVIEPFHKRTIWRVTHQALGMSMFSGSKAKALAALRAKLYHLHVHGDLPPTDLVRSYSGFGFTNQRGDDPHPELQRAIVAQLVSQRGITV